VLCPGHPARQKQRLSLTRGCCSQYSRPNFERLLKGWLKFKHRINRVKHSIHTIQTQGKWQHWARSWRQLSYVTVPSAQTATIAYIRLRCKNCMVCSSACDRFPIKIFSLFILRAEWSNLRAATIINNRAVFCRKLSSATRSCQPSAQQAPQSFRLYAWTPHTVSAKFTRLQREFSCNSSEKNDWQQL